MERQLGGSVMSSRRMTGGLGSAVHRVTLRTAGGASLHVVLRQYESEVEAPIAAEMETLRALAGTDVIAPELLAASVGEEVDGRPTLVMSRMPGRLELAPSNPDDWLRQMARAAVEIHDLSIAAPPFEPWYDPTSREVPARATDPALWRSTFALLQQPASSAPTAFIHRDFQHFNLLWLRGKLSGVIDWTCASTGPPEIDVGHARLNLAVLYSVDWAERFRHAYEAETGAPIDPWWDLHANAEYGNHMAETIATQVDRRVPVDAEGMTRRVESLVAAARARM